MPGIPHAGYGLQELTGHEQGCDERKHQVQILMHEAKMETKAKVWDSIIEQNRDSLPLIK